MGNDERQDGSRLSPRAGAGAMSRRRVVVAGLLAVVAALAALPAAAGAQSVSSYVYWDNPQAGAIGRDTLDGDPTNVNQSFISGLKQINGIGVAVDREHIYWTEGLFISRANLDGTGIEPEFIKRDRGGGLLAVDDQHIYWASAGSRRIGTASLDGTDIVEDYIDLTGESVALEAIAVDSSYVYWADSLGRRIGRATPFGTSVDADFIPNAGVALGVAVDGQHVYWANRSAVGIGRANLDGTGVEPSSSPRTSPRDSLWA